MKFYSLDEASMFHHNIYYINPFKLLMALLQILVYKFICIM